MLTDKVEREQRVPQVVEDPHENHEVELLAERRNVIDVELHEFDVAEIQDFGGKPRLREVALVAVYAQHPARATALHLDRIEARVAADIEHALAAEVARQVRREAAELRARIIAEKMVGRSPGAAEVQVVEPRAKRGDAGLKIGARHRTQAGLDNLHLRSGSVRQLKIV